MCYYVALLNVLAVSGYFITPMQLHSKYNFRSDCKLSDVIFEGVYSSVRVLGFFLVVFYLVLGVFF